MTAKVDRYERSDLPERHKAALRGYGPSAIHRRSWVFMDHLPWPGMQRPLPEDAQQSLFA